MKNKLIKYFGFLVTFFSPVFAFAAFENLRLIVTDIGVLLGMVYRLTFGLALLFFMWGMGQFILKAGDSKARDEGRQKMIWGVVAIFVMFSIFGIVQWIGDALDIDVGGSTTIPTAPPPPTTGTFI